MSDEGREIHALMSSWWEMVINFIQYFNQNFKLIMNFFLKNPSNLELSNAYWGAASVEI